jgi:protein-S-isoprenylcysteine O-methyltransferase Ste14
MIAIYDRWDNVAAMTYLALHGAYGFFWIMKSRNFGDRQWDQPCSGLEALQILVGLTAYWITPWLICHYDIHPPAAWIGLCIFLFGFGVFYHFVSDMQKFCWIEFNPGHLLTEGLRSNVRNPNYFGELLIYAGFSALAMHWAPFLVLGMFVFGIWVPNMRRKDGSLSRYAEFGEYRAKSKLFIPYVV